MCVPFNDCQPQISKGLGNSRGKLKPKKRAQLLWGHKRVSCETDLANAKSFGTHKVLFTALLLAVRGEGGMHLFSSLHD